MYHSFDDESNKHFIMLLQLGAGLKEQCNFPPLSREEWTRIIQMARQHAVTGILLDGINQIEQQKYPPQDLMMPMIATLLAIEKENARLNSKLEEIFDYFHSHHFHPILLKGQGNAQYYPFPEHRMSGDIDLWLTDDDKTIRQFIKKRFPESQTTYHHISFPKWENTIVEIHTTPSWMYHPSDNARLQTYFQQSVMKQDMKGVPSKQFNRVYLMIHLYRHFLEDGIGFRQLLDYAMLLKQGSTQEEKDEAMQILKRIHLDKFCGGIMYVLHQLLQLNEKDLITPPLATEGSQLANEIIQAGDLGKFDKSYRRPRETENKLQRFLRKIWRNFSFIKYYPREIIFAPMFKCVHLIWRLKMDHRV